MREVAGSSVSLDLCAAIRPLGMLKSVTPKTKSPPKPFSEDVIRILSFDQDIFQSNTVRETCYRFLVPELYRRLTGTALPSNIDVVTYWKRQSGLGEIHSIAMCLVDCFSPMTEIPKR